MTKRVLFFNLSIILLLFISSAAFGENHKYSYDFSNPESIVNSACLMIMYADYPEMLKITEMMEKKRTLSTIEEITNAKVREYLVRESEKIIKFEIIGVEDFTNNITNQLIIYTVKWVLKIDPAGYLENSPYKAVDINKNKEKKSESIVYTDYLLKKFDNGWKIISKKSK